MEGQDRIILVIFSSQKRLEALLFERLAHAVHFALCFFKQGQVLLLVGKLNERLRVLILGHQRIVRLYLALQGACLLQHLLALLHVIPKARLGGAQLELFDLRQHVLHAERVGEVVYFRLERLQGKH